MLNRRSRRPLLIFEIVYNEVSTTRGKLGDQGMILGLELRFNQLLLSEVLEVVNRREVFINFNAGVVIEFNEPVTLSRRGDEADSVQVGDRWLQEPLDFGGCIVSDAIHGETSS
jgi:hypothetical protein